jgi:hypothetical protein
MTNFTVGADYTREQVAERVGMPEVRRRGNWDTGWDTYGNEHFIFCNIGIPGRTGHQYANRWQNGRLIWSAKRGTRLGQAQVNSLLSGTVPVHIFWRGRSRAPFTYAGLAIAEAAQDVSPVEVTWLLEADRLLSPEVIDVPLWKRGPPPWTGEYALYKQDGPTSVYLMALDGASRAIFPGIPDGSVVAKIGMSNDPLRRLIELNGGFPPGCILKWKLIRTRKYPSGREAYLAEGELLEHFRSRQRWIGNEFVWADGDDLKKLLC